LHTAPTSAAWVAERVAWLPVFALALGVLLCVFRRAERAPRQADPAEGRGRVASAPSGNDVVGPTLLQEEQ
jgi:hypothetical protein